MHQLSGLHALSVTLLDITWQPNGVNAVWRVKIIIVEHKHITRKKIIFIWINRTNIYCSCLYLDYDVASNCHDDCPGPWCANPTLCSPSANFGGCNGEHKVLFSKMCKKTCGICSGDGKFCNIFTEDIKLFFYAPKET